MTRWHLGNHNCKQILLGISHDAGYAPFLDEIVRNTQTKRRIAILEGVPSVRELGAIGVQTLNLSDTIFRHDKLTDRSAPAPTLLPLLQPLPPVKAPSSIASTPPTTSYATVIQNASPPPQLILPLAPKNINAITRSAVSKPPPWNPGPRGIDPYIPSNPAAVDSIKKRKDSNKLCNNHYLRGPCAKGDSCCFEHHYKPSPDEINAIAVLARLNPCTNGQDCEVEDCIYGHHVRRCRATDNGRSIS
jgi:hypothetical protein